MTCITEQLHRPNKKKRYYSPLEDSIQSPQIWSYKIWDNAYLPSEGTLQENKKCTYPLGSLQYSESMQHHGLGTQGVQQKVFLSS